MNHYAFHIMDRDWGHLIIRFCPHPPFNALVILNGHEWVAKEAERRRLAFRKQDNCFTELSNARDQGLVADALSRPGPGPAGPAHREDPLRAPAASEATQRAAASSGREVSLETPEYNLTILRIRVRRLTLKIYTNGERVLRIEAMAHNARDLGCRLGASYFPEAVEVPRQIVDRFIRCSTAWTRPSSMQACSTGSPGRAASVPSASAASTSTILVPVP